ncbi:MAG: hypothetical protein HQ582_27960, partial [Planctomycetes bacterium]|nr:hypothetical protein [Planctomycetota bacterium]
MSPLQKNRLGRFTLLATVSLAALLIVSHVAQAQSRSYRYPGKIVIVRGAFNVFSLGLDDLGDKLRRRGFNVDVSSPSDATSAGARARKAYQANPAANPIVIIGHSAGGKLAPQMARQMERYNVPVRLIFILDAPERTSIPANVERCVNYYQSIPTGFVRGYPSRAQGASTEMVNFDIARKQGLSLNHFNIDATDWIHNAVIAEVVRSCTQPRIVEPPSEDAVTAEQKEVAAKPKKKADAKANAEKVAATPKKETDAAVKAEKVAAKPK